MRKLLINLMFAGGLWAAAGTLAQERVERAERLEQRVEAPLVNPRLVVPDRGESLRGESLRLRSPTPYQSGSARDAMQRDFRFSERPRSDMQTQQRLRDPRVIDYRTRGWTDEPPGRSVSHDMQRAIERAQSEHGGKVLSADRIRYRGQDTYRVKLLTPSGRVRVVQLSEPAVPEAVSPDAAAADDQSKGDE